MTEQKEGVDLAPMDPLGREIQRVLELIRPRGPEAPEPRYAGYADAAPEAYMHLSRMQGGPAPRVMRHKDGALVRWWLLDEAGRVIDLALAPADRRALKADPSRRHPYEEGRGAMFRTGPNRASKRAAAIISLVQAGVAQSPAKA